MSKTNTVWHKYPDEKPKSECCKYIVIFRDNGELKATDCFWLKEKFTGGVEDSLVEAWTEMPYAQLEGIYVKPNECPYGDCESNYVIGVGGKIYDCEVCQQVHIIKKYTENKKNGL